MDNNQIIENVSQNLKYLRKKTGLSQDALIKSVGDYKISLRSYKTYESGKSSRLPSLDKLITLAVYFNVSLDYLICSKESTYDDSFTKRDQLKRLNRLVSTLTLIPIKETDPKSDYFGRYYFISYEDDVSDFVDKTICHSSISNRKFESKLIPPFGTLKNFDNLINEIDDLDGQFVPTLEKMNKYLELNGINPNEYYSDKRRRIINKHKQDV